MLARRGLALLAKVEESPERQARELSLQSVLGTSLAATQGYAAPEVLVAMARARVLAEELGQQPRARAGDLGLVRVLPRVRRHARSANDGRSLLRRAAESANDPLMLVGAHCATGMSMMYTGNVAGARVHCEHAATFYSRDMRPAYHAMYRMDPGVFVQQRARPHAVGDGATRYRAHRARRRARARRRESRSAKQGVVTRLRWRAPSAAARGTAHPRAFVEVRSRSATRTELRRSVSGRWRFTAGRSLIPGKVDEGIKEIEASIAIQRSRHAELNLTFALRQLAEALNVRRLVRRWRATRRATDLKISERHGEVASKVELYRIMGESARALAQTGEIEAATHTRSGSTLSPEACFRAAVELARKQGAKSFELRSSVALGRTMVDRGMEPEALELVTAIRSQFTEGAGTADILDADAFLRSIST